MPAAAIDLDLMARFASRLAERLGPHLLRVALFGSRARGSAWAGSDYDVFLLVDANTPAVRDEIYTVAYEFAPVDLNLHIYTPEQLAQARRLGTPVPRDLEREGITLWPPTHA